MPLFKVYLVIEKKFKIIDSIWQAKADAEEKAETLSISKTPLDDSFRLEWVVQEHEVL